MRSCPTALRELLAIRVWCAATRRAPQQDEPSRVGWDRQAGDSIGKHDQPAGQHEHQLRQWHALIAADQLAADRPCLPFGVVVDDDAELPRIARVPSEQADVFGGLFGGQDPAKVGPSRQARAAVTRTRRERSPLAQDFQARLRVQRRAAAVAPRHADVVAQHDGDATVLGSKLVEIVAASSAV